MASLSSVQLSRNTACPEGAHAGFAMCAQDNHVRAGLRRQFSQG